MPERTDFNRGAALSAGIALLPPNSLLLLADVDILIGEGALERIRLNTVLGKQVVKKEILYEIQKLYSHFRSIYLLSSENIPQLLGN